MKRRSSRTRNIELRRGRRRRPEGRIRSRCKRRSGRRLLDQKRGSGPRAPRVRARRQKSRVVARAGAVDAGAVDAVGGHAHARAEGRGDEGAAVAANLGVRARVRRHCAEATWSVRFAWDEKGRRCRGWCFFVGCGGEGLVGFTGAAIVCEDGAGAVDGCGEDTALAVEGVGVCLDGLVEDFAGRVGVETDGGCGGDEGMVR